MDNDFPQVSASNTDDGSTDGSNSLPDLDDPLREELSLEEAVRKYPHFAIDELGSRLGLVVEDIRNFQERAARHREQHQQQVAKRRQIGADTAAVDDTKRARKSEPASPPKYVLPIQPLVSDLLYCGCLSEVFIYWTGP